MLLQLQELIETYNIKLKGTIHVGAHWGEEYETYKECGVQEMIFFEPIQASFRKLSESLKDKSIILVNKAVGNSNKMVSMYTETVNKGQSNSILKPTRHLTDYPNISFDGTEEVEMVKLDDFITSPEKYNFLNLDVQGYELEVLKGAADRILPNIDAIVTEVNSDQLYEGGVVIEDLDEFLRPHSFRRVETKWWKKSCWGDALYLKS